MVGVRLAAFPDVDLRVGDQHAVLSLLFGLSEGVADVPGAGACACAAGAAAVMASVMTKLRRDTRRPCSIA
jgi:hypothetical protein